MSYAGEGVKAIVPLGQSNRSFGAKHRLLSGKAKGGWFLGCDRGKIYGNEEGETKATS